MIRQVAAFGSTDIQVNDAASKVRPNFDKRLSFVSVIVCTYNRAAKLQKCLDSILRTTAPPTGIGWELVCVDNNSTDQTRLVIERVGRTASVSVVYVHEHKQGPSYARNTGIQHAKGDLFIVTDDDCIADPGWISNICQEFLLRPDLGLLGGRIELLDERRPPISVRTAPNKIDATEGNILGLVCGNNIAFRRSVIDRVGHYDERLSAGEDLDLSYRVFAANEQVSYAPEPLVFHDHERSSELDWKNSCISYLRARGAFYAKHITGRDLRATRMAYWEILTLLKSGFRATSLGPTTTTGLRIVGYLLEGAFFYLLRR